MVPVPAEKNNEYDTDAGTRVRACVPRAITTQFFFFRINVIESNHPNENRGTVANFHLAIDLGKALCFEYVARVDGRDWRSERDTTLEIVVVTLITIASSAQCET